MLCLVRSPLRREAHAQATDGMYEVIRRDVDRTIPLDIRQACQKLAIRLLQLDLRHALAKADVRTIAERQMLVRVYPPI